MGVGPPRAPDQVCVYKDLVVTTHLGGMGPVGVMRCRCRDSNGSK